MNQFWNSKRQKSMKVKNLHFLVMSVDTKPRKKMELNSTRRKKHEVPQNDGSIFISKEKEVQTQTDIFLNINTECEIVGPYLADIYSEPPPSV